MVIRVRGARQNNLKNLSLDLPAGEIAVVTGVSGSGKSSLVFDTIYAEGQRRYIETFSAYARQFLDRMDKPLVDSIEGVPPAIAIDQTNPVRSSRSTVGTMTELADHLKLLFARSAQLVCPGCSQPVGRDTIDSIATLVMAQPEGQRIAITFERDLPEQLEDAQLEEWLSTQGFTKIHRRVARLAQIIADRFVLTPDLERSRVTEAIEAALRFGEGKCQVVLLADDQVLRFSSSLSCAACSLQFREPRPALFSFNSPVGACDACRGFGRVIGIDPGLVVPNESLSLESGAIKPWQTKSYDDCQAELMAHAKLRGVATDIAWKDLPEEDRRWVFEGDEHWSGNWKKQWYGVYRFFEYLEGKAYKMHVRMLLSRYRSYTECPSCHGARLKPEALNWRVQGRNLAEVMSFSIDQTWDWLQTQLPPAPDDTRAPVGRDTAVSAGQAGRAAAADLVFKEMTARLRFCREVGLGYLTLDRQSRTLSGGEVQRINLTTALGTSLVNTLFVLDEPSIGLHPRDLQRLIGVMHRLRDAGNSLLVVEHDPEVMQSAHRIIDMGPGPGERGGEIQFNGSFAELAQSQTLTGQYLRGERQVFTDPPAPRAKVVRAPQLRLRGLRAHNLKNIELSIPLQHLVALTGVSGSGKSTLVQDVLYPALCKHFGKATEAPGPFDAMEGAALLADVLLVDQSPIGRTTRSNPAVYVGAFDAIRRRFADSAIALQRGYTTGTFSFNAGTGRCPTCSGSGYEQVEMQFLSDVYLACPDCRGSRFKPETLEALVQGKSIADVLSMTVSEALQFFGEDRDVRRRLAPLVDVGLDYLRLGQPVPTLSGGEAQRLKIAGHLAEAAERGGRAKRGMLLLFDEPTTGLHFDDIAKLIRALRALVTAGHSLMVIEHNLDLISAADWIIDLGPDAGPAGGELVAEGQQEDIMACPQSATGQALLRIRSLLVAEAPSVGRPLQGSADAGELNASDRANAHGQIEIHHAREHNLKDVSINIPRDKLTVISGVSGSGKSTLAFDILFAEGQRRYLESLNAYARQFVQPASRPEVDAIYGIPPTVAIEQRTSRGGRKSTVGTLTEVHHFLRLLYVKLGTQTCPNCEIPIAPQSPEAIQAGILRDYKGQHVGLLAPLVIARKGIYQDLARWAAARGHTHLRVDGEFLPTDKFPKLDRYREHTIELPVGDLVVSADAEPALAELVAKALENGQGSLSILAPLEGGRPLQTQLLSTKRACPSCSLSLPEPEPRLFSYNTKLGWCPRCTGTGRLLPDIEKEDTGEEERYLQLDESPESSEEDIACPDCDGARLNPMARAIRLREMGIHDVSRMALDELPTWLDDLADQFDARSQAIGEGLLQEIKARVDFLRSVGLGYLSLDRAAPTLSGGEAQRIRLAAQLGSNLQGVCYILDEPSIGLHPQDNQALLSLLRKLQEKGNTLVVVEHDEDTIAMADHLIDMGPGAGKRGGEVVAQGDQAALMAHPDSITGRYLRSPMAHPEEPQRPPADDWLEIRGARLHNLKQITVPIPLGRLTVVTGVSGSGKSSLVRDVLRHNLSKVVGQQRTKAGRAKSVHWDGCAEITRWDSIQRVLEVDQTPIGKTPRSTPATYVGFWDDIRKRFAESEEAKRRGWTAARFSFNTGNGRCETCEGQGWQTIEMNFLPDVRVVCDACSGSRFNAETRGALWRGKSIADVLAFSVDEALEYFEAMPTVRRPLQLLQEVGLGYLSLGQPSPTLSGGESQRIKLVTELAKTRQSGQTLYVLDEPTVGLHMADVEKLIHALHRLVEAGHTVVVIEHQLDVWAQADWIVDLGPRGGAAGGQLIASGPPSIIRQQDTPTGRALQTFLSPRR